MSRTQQTCQYIENVFFFFFFLGGNNNGKIIVETWRKPSLKVRAHENRPEGTVGSIPFSLDGVLYRGENLEHLFSSLLHFRFRQKKYETRIKYKKEMRNFFWSLDQTCSSFEFPSKK